MKKILLATLILFVAQTLMINKCLAFGVPTSFISGSVWVDTNNNNVQELSEELVADIKVFAMNQDTQDVTETRTNHKGTFVMAGMPYGFYSIWCEDRNGAKTTPYFMEVNEVAGTAEAVDFALENLKFTPKTQPQNPTVMPGFSNQPALFMIFLPIVNN